MNKLILPLLALTLAAPALAVVNKNADNAPAQAVPAADYNALRASHETTTKCLADKGKALNGVISVAEINKLTVAMQDAKFAYEKPSMTDFTAAKADWNAAKAAFAKVGC